MESIVNTIISNNYIIINNTKYLDEIDRNPIDGGVAPERLQRRIRAHDVLPQELRLPTLRFNG